MRAQNIGSRRLALGGLVAIATALGIGRFIYTPILPPMADALALSKGQAGLIASANFIGYLAGALAAVMPWFRRHPRGALLGFLALSGSTTAGMAWPDTMWSFLALRFLGGLASAYVLVLSSSLVLERLADAGRGDLASVHFAGVGVGITLSAVLTWALASQGSDWRGMWLWSGLLTLLAVPLVAALVSDRAPQSHVRIAARTVADPVALRRLSLAYGLFGFGYVITITFIVVMVRGAPEAARYEPVFWLAIGLAAIPSVAVWAAASRRYGVATAYAAACALQAVGVLASVASTGTLALLTSAVLMGATFMGVTSLGIIGTRSFAGPETGRWIAIATSAFSVGQIAGPVAAGYGYDMTGSFVLPSAMAAAALCASAALAFGLRGRSQTQG